MIAAMFCVASAVYFEARGEPIEGQAAVAWVIYHRTAAQQSWPSDSAANARPIRRRFTAILRCFYE